MRKDSRNQPPRSALRPEDSPAVGKELRATFLQEIRSIDEKARTIEFVASTEAVDRYGDIIRVAGWKYDNYLKNPVFLWAHQHGQPPIGKTVDLKIESKPPALVQTVEFADAVTYPFADTIFRLYKNKFMRAVSVGFMSLEQPTPMKDDEGNMTGWEFTSQELLELSACPIPANQEALARAVKGGEITEADVKKFFGIDEESYPSFGVAFAAPDRTDKEKKNVEPKEKPVEKSSSVPSTALGDMLAKVVETGNRLENLRENVARQVDIENAVAVIAELRNKLQGVGDAVAALINGSATKTELADVVSRFDEIRSRLDKLTGAVAKEPAIADVVTRVEELRGKIERISSAAVKKTDLVDMGTKIDALHQKVDNLSSVAAKHPDMQHAIQRLGENRVRIDAVRDEMVKEDGIKSLSDSSDGLHAKMDKLSDAVAKDEDMDDISEVLKDHRARLDSLSANSVTKEDFSALRDVMDEHREKLDEIAGLLRDTYNNPKPPRPESAKPEEEKSVCPYTDDAIAPKGTTWDASTEMAKQTTPAGWKHLCTVTVGDSKLKGSYKLPHHSGNDFKVIPNGVRAALGRLESTQMDSADRAGARSHLVKHQKKISEQTGIDFDGEAFETKLAQLGEAYRAANAAGLSALAESVGKEIEAHVATLDPPKTPSKPGTISTVEDLFASLTSKP